MNKYYSLLMVVFLAACGGVPVGNIAPSKPSLVDLKPAFVPEKNSDLPSASLDKLRELYLQALAASNDPDVHRQIKARLASIEMERSEERLVDGSEEKQLFAEAVKAYKDVIAQYPTSNKKDKHMYQLARAYDLNGEPKKSLEILSNLVGVYGDSQRYIESQFRLAENSFSARKYLEAVHRYTNVVEKGMSPYYENGLYMLAWSEFKVGDYDSAIDTFIAVLDLLLQEPQEAENFSRGKQEIVEDSFRMLSVSFATLEGHKSLAQAIVDHGEKKYSADLYRSLAQYYFSLERIKDSADTYKAFIQKYPLTREAYQFQISKIDVYKKGGFRQEVLNEKKEFVFAYTVRGAYWLLRDDEQRRVLDKYLKEYIVELASYYHTLAQQAADVTLDLTRIKDKKINNKLKDSNREKSIAYYQQAAKFYNLFVESFPYDQRVAEMLFLLAESQYEAGGYQLAINSYERVAYQFRDYEKAVEAGYAAILTYDKLATSLSINESPVRDANNTIIQEKIASSLLFAKVFPQDDRAVLVQLAAAQSLLKLKDYQGAITAAEELTQWQDTYQQIIEESIVVSAWLVVAQSSFDNQDYLYAESAYGQVLNLMPSKDVRRADIHENYAASIYQQGAIASDQGNYSLAAEHYSRVITSAPNSSIRITAQYDAATSYFKIKSWKKAIELLTDFRQRFPGSSFVNSIAPSLALAYQELGQWRLAASEMKVVYKTESDLEKKAQLLFLTAELYEKANDTAQAIIHYREYAHNYKQPIAINIEAMQKMGELYIQTKEIEKQYFWLRKIIKADAQAKENRTDRTRYLAAAATSVFADDAYQAFKSIRITLPIKKPLQRKKKALSSVIKHYKTLSAYDISEFSTLSSYRLAEVYGQLSRDLLDSERPASLGELELEQYEILLEEQAYPFEEKAIEIHERNVKNSWNGVYDQWVKKSVDALGVLLPARYNKQEKILTISEGVY